MKIAKNINKICDFVPAFVCVVFKNNKAFGNSIHNGWSDFSFIKKLDRDFAQKKTYSTNLVKIGQSVWSLSRSQNNIVFRNPYVRGYRWLTWNRDCLWRVGGSTRW